MDYFATARIHETGHKLVLVDAPIRPSVRGVPMGFAKRQLLTVSVGLVVLEHGVEDVVAASGQANQSCIVFLSFGAFAVVVGVADRVV